MKKIDLTGQTFNHLTVQERLGSRLMGSLRKKHAIFWKCQCVCGAFVELDTGRILSGNTRSCGCLRRETSARLHTKHGCSGLGRVTPEYRSWQAMHRLCYNPNRKDYKKVGGQRVRVCQQWHDFAAFLRDMGPRPSLGHGLHRLDGGKDYAPGNCAWVTREGRALLQNTTPEGRWICPNGGGQRRHWVRAAWRRQYGNQAGACPVCGKPLSSEFSACRWDHDHSTGLYRGILHPGCNTFVGFIETHSRQLEGARAYICQYGGKA
jgi:hypothetical protein